MGGRGGQVRPARGASWGGGSTEPDYLSRHHYNTLYLPQILERIQNTTPKGSGRTSRRCSAEVIYQRQLYVLLQEVNHAAGMSLRYGIPKGKSMDLGASSSRSIVCATLAFVMIAYPTSSIGQSEQVKPHAKIVKLDTAGKDYLQVLAGPPETVTMQSDLVVLAPNQTVGKHSTKLHEEVLIVLEGEGKMIFADGSTLPVKANTVLSSAFRREYQVPLCFVSATVVLVSSHSVVCAPQSVAGS